MVAVGAIAGVEVVIAANADVVIAAIDGAIVSTAAIIVDELTVASIIDVVAITAATVVEAAGMNVTFRKPL